MARLSRDEGDRALWLTLAQSWVRLAEHVVRTESRRDPASGEGGDGQPQAAGRA